jgi:hypothetical protein
LAPSASLNATFSDSLSTPSELNGGDTVISVGIGYNGVAGYPNISTGGNGGNGSNYYHIQQGQGVYTLYCGSAGGNGGACFASSTTQGSGYGTSGTPGASYASGTPGSTGTSTPAYVPLTMTDSQTYNVSAGQESEAGSPGKLMVYYYTYDPEW